MYWYIYVCAEIPPPNQRRSPRLYIPSDIGLPIVLDSSTNTERLLGAGARLYIYSEKDLKGGGWDGAGQLLYCIY